MIIKKVLSKNDTGETGGHQAGILVPKDEKILSFFPYLNKSLKNPRMEMVLNDHSNHEWHFMFIYYNNAFFGGTRNEYRLTGMTKYIRSNNLKAGDTVVFEKNTYNEIFISYQKENDININDIDFIELTGKWKIYKI